MFLVFYKNENNEDVVKKFPHDQRREATDFAREIGCEDVILIPEANIIKVRKNLVNYNSKIRMAIGVFEDFDGEPMLESVVLLSKSKENYGKIYHHDAIKVYNKDCDEIYLNIDLFSDESTIRNCIIDVEILEECFTGYRHLSDMSKIERDFIFDIMGVDN